MSNSLPYTKRYDASQKNFLFNVSKKVIWIKTFASNYSDFRWSNDLSKRTAIETAQIRLCGLNEYGSHNMRQPHALRLKYLRCGKWWTYSHDLLSVNEHDDNNWWQLLMEYKMVLEQLRFPLFSSDSNHFVHHFINRRTAMWCSICE